MKNLRSRLKDQRGFNLIELMIVIAIIGLLIGVGSYAWSSMIRSGNESAAAQSITQLRTFQVQYAAKNRGKFGTFAELISAVGLDEKFKGETPVVNGYVFTMTAEPSSDKRPAKFIIHADPQGEGVSASGTRHFYTDSELGTIKVNDQQPAVSADPSI